MKEPYGVGLDIGTNSVGWTVVDASGHVRKIKGQTGIGVRLFKEGAAAADRRGFRTTRRRLKRVKWRLRLLREFFDQSISLRGANIRIFHLVILIITVLKKRCLMIGVIRISIMIIQRFIIYVRR